jgi:hypothetical protein
MKKCQVAYLVVILGAAAAPALAQGTGTDTGHTWQQEREQNIPRSQTYYPGDVQHEAPRHNIEPYEAPAFRPNFPDAAPRCLSIHGC